MMKRLALLCCILLLPTIVAAAPTPDGNTHYGNFWVGGQSGAVFTLDPNGITIDPGFSAGAIAGYNFCMPYRQVWERYFGVALDFQWNQFNWNWSHFNVKGHQFALSFLGRLQYPLMGSERFTFGRLVPFLMAGPSIVWTDFGGGRKTDTDVGVVAEVGLEFFMVPHVSIGPSFRYRHVFSNPDLDQMMVLGRLAYHF
jgi:opacity protein-like surface antigen